METNKSLKQACVSFWDSLQLQNPDFAKMIVRPTFAEYGENQDLVQATVEALMPKHGYIRPETVSVYFRSYKAKARRIAESIRSA